MQLPASICPAQRMISIFLLTVFYIGSDDKRSIVKNLFDFCLRHTMFFIFSRISSVPVETGNLRPVHMYILIMYNLKAANNF